jgi:hypothetical protein
VLTIEVGYVAVDAPWHGVPSGTRMVGLGTLLTSFGAIIQTLARLHLRIQPQIGDKPALESCVVSQVVADTLARLPLEGCRDT